MSELALGGAAGLLLAAPLTVPAHHALADRTAAEAALARVRKAAAAPEAPDLSSVESPQVLRARSQAAARQRLSQRIRTLAGSGGVLVEALDAVDESAPVATLRLRASGGEKAVIAFADTLERDGMLVRLQAWRMQAIADGQLRLDAQVVAPWRR